MKMRTIDTSKIFLLLLGLLSSTADAFTSTTSTQSSNQQQQRRRHHYVAVDTQLDAAATIAITSKAGEKDLKLTRQVIRDHQKRSKTVSTEQFIQQMEQQSLNKKKNKDEEEVVVPVVPVVSSFFDDKSSELIEQTKKLFDPDIMLGLADGGECLAENFQFCAAVVGPIGKEPFLEALSGFKLEDSFDIQQNRFGFTVSPAQPNRVYFLTSNTAQMTSNFMGVSKDDAKNNGNLILPPECHHADFDENMKITEYGFYTVDRQYGNTGGLGGAFGFFYGVGKGLPFREAMPFKKSFRYSFFSWIGNKMSSRKKKK
jgi:hypothetical protein